MKVRVTTLDGVRHDYEGAGWSVQDGMRDGGSLLHISRLVGDSRQAVAVFACWEYVELIDE